MGAAHTDPDAPGRSGKEACVAVGGRGSGGAQRDAAPCIEHGFLLGFCVWGALPIRPRHPALRFQPGSKRFPIKA